MCLRGIPVIDVRNVSKRYGWEPDPVLALDKVNLAIDAGAFAAVVGPSGCGKSTLLHLLAGADTPSAGEIRVDGHLLTALTDAELSRFRRDHIGLVYQFYNLIPTLSAWENVALPALLTGGSARDARTRAQEWLGRVGLRHRNDHWPHELSGGEMQRVAIARAMVNSPRVLLADEPTGNLDSVAGRSLIELLQRINGEQGVTIVMATHSQEAAAAASRVIHMKDGHIVSDGDR